MHARIRSPWVGRFAWLVLLAGQLLAARVLAQAPVAGDGRSALPGYVLTRIADEAPRGLSARAGIAYGYTEAQSSAPGAHHRASGSLAISGRPTPWLGLGLSLDGRLDAHPGDSNDTGLGIATRASFELRAASTLSSGLSLGAAAMILGLGGAGGGLELGATSVEASALVGWAGSGSRIALEAGYRYDRSARAAPGYLLSGADRLALGLSSFDAVLVRLAVGHRFGASELFLEGSLDALVGAGRPAFSRSPMHAVAGLRQHIGRSLLLDVYLDVGLASRATLPAAAPYVPVDPRVAAGIALAYRFAPGSSAGSAGESSDQASVPPDEADPEADDDPSGPSDDDARSLSGRVLTEGGEPLVDAHVVLTIGEQRVEAYTDAEGGFVLRGLPAGAARLRIEAVGHETQEVELGARATRLPYDAVRMVRASPHGMLRGTVEGFDGESVAATVTVTPGESVVAVDATGAFEVSLAPGRYRVHIEAPGYVAQTREVRLTDGTVTIVHAELRRTR